MNYRIKTREEMLASGWKASNCDNNLFDPLGQINFNTQMHRYHNVGITDAESKVVLTGKRFKRDIFSFSLSMCIPVEEQVIETFKIY